MREDGLRTYVRVLRDAAGYSQPALAKVIGLSPDAYGLWERGQTEDLKLHPFVRLLTAIGAAFDDVATLVLESGDAPLGRQLAERRLTAPADGACADLTMVLQQAVAQDQVGTVLEQLAAAYAARQDRSGGWLARRRRARSLR